MVGLFFQISSFQSDRAQLNFTTVFLPLDDKIIYHPSSSTRKMHFILVSVTIEPETQKYKTKEYTSSQMLMCGANVKSLVVLTYRYYRYVLAMYFEYCGIFRYSLKIG